VTCARCGFANPEGMGFCGECGSALVVHSCPRCGFHSPRDFTFCGKCGIRLEPTRESESGPLPRAYTPRHLAEKVLRLRDALQGERKQVTVLFADVKESLSLAEQIDAETWHQVLDRFFAILAEGVHRFEGTINQYTGDGIMALFGAPIAHEDHAQRACHAAWYLREALRRYADSVRLRGLNFSVRMGLNSGEVVVGKIGDDLRMDYTAQGHTVGLAARMEQIAEAGSVYVTQSTARLVDGFFRLRDLGETRVKGVQDTVRVYELEGVGGHQSRFEVSRARGLSRFVGRGDELSVLDVALHRAGAGDGQVVGIIGEAGMGKSRLCYEFVERCRARGLPVVQAHGVAHGEAVPLTPVSMMLRGFFEIGDSDSEATVRDKVAGRMLRLAPESTEMLPVLYDCLGVPDPDQPAPVIDALTRQHALGRVVMALLQAQARRGLHVLLLEDLHWFDRDSAAVVTACVEAAADSHSLLIVNFRPDHRPEWMTKSYYQQIALRPLSTDAVGELLGDLLGDDPSLAPLEPMIRKRTGGNPFFVEEIVCTLAESGSLGGDPGSYRLLRPVETIAVPATVQATLTARIDRLDESAKAVLHTAAVIGKEFTEALLQRVVESALPDLGTTIEVLMRSEFVSERAGHPQRVYAFKHPLTQEVAYRSQLAERRASTHAAVARALEELHAGRLGEQAAFIAHHWEAANKPYIAARWRRRAALHVTTIQLPRPQRRR